MFPALVYPKSVKLKHVTWRPIARLPPNTCLESLSICGNPPRKRLNLWVCNEFARSKPQVIKILKKNGIAVTADLLSKFNFSVEQFQADSRLLTKGKKKKKMKQTTSTQPSNSPIIDVEVDFSFLGKNFTVKSTPSRKNEVWIPPEEILIDGTTLQDNIEPELQAFEQYYCEKSDSFHTYCLEQLSSNDAPPVGLSDNRLNCPGNVAFKCSQANNSLSCQQDIWTEILSMLNGVSELSLQKKIEMLTWRVCPFYGILEILASNVVVWTTKVETVHGPICSFCERYVSRIYRREMNSCKSCEHNYITTLIPQTPRILDIPKEDVPQNNKTLVFLCGRMSGGSPLTPGFFENLVTSLEQSESNSGRFGRYNRPGLPAKMEIVGKFVARATATTKIDTRYAKTIRAPPDWLPMYLLPEYIIFRYWPGNSIIIGMTTPSCLTVSPNHLRTFIEEIFARGIPRDSLFFYCHSLQAISGHCQKYETVILAEEYISALELGEPTYGIRPAHIGYLHETIIESTKREKATKFDTGRNIPIVEKKDTHSQSIRKKRECEEMGKLICCADGCNGFIAEISAIKCGDCSRWCHLNCLGLESAMVTSLDQHGWQFKCDSCLLNAATSQRTVVPASSYTASYLELNVIHTVTVTFVKNGPQNFVIQRSNSNDVENLKRLSKELAEFANHNSRTLVNVALGSPCIAISSRDQLFHRGVITIVEDMWYAQVYFVDHGYTELVELQSVFEIPIELLSIELFAYRVLLEDFANLMKTDNVSNIFARMVLNKTFKCTVTGETLPQSVILEDVDGRNVKDLILAVISDSRQHFNNCEEFLSTPPSPMTATRNIMVARGEVGSEEDLFVTCVGPPGNFFGQFEKHQVTELDALKSELQLIYSSCNAEQHAKIALLYGDGNSHNGDYGVIKWSTDRQYYRIQIVNEFAQYVEITFVDYGTNIKVCRPEIWALPCSHNLLSKPPFGINCFIAGISLNEDDWVRLVYTKSVRVKLGQPTHGVFPATFVDIYANNVMCQLSTNSNQSQTANEFVQGAIMLDDSNCSSSDESDSSHSLNQNDKSPAAADPHPAKLLKSHTRNWQISPMFNFDPHSESDSPDEESNNHSVKDSQDSFNLRRLRSKPLKGQVIYDDDDD